MKDQLEKSVQTLHERFGGEVGEFRGDPRITVSPEHIQDVATVLREELGFEYLSGLTAVDYWPEMDPRFHVVYQISSFQHNCRLEVRVPIPGNEPIVPTISEIYYNAAWNEREIFDMFGIEIEGHPDLRRLIMPHDWEGHPLRKDYPLGYEEVQFTFNLDEIDLRKLKPKE